MEWEGLLSSRRFSGVTLEPIAPDVLEPHISVFQKDAERIIYSTPFRRLQGKTQVHPLPVYDYLRTRLTHTIEVANVGRIIANEIGKNFQNKNKYCDPIVFGDIVYAACLAHDVGNPPFGHVGEYAIQTWFREQRELKNEVVSDVLANNSYKNDFLHFDGNAQGFRILTRLTGWRHMGGLRLAHATMGAFSKYPYGSDLSSEEKKKFGFMHAERAFAEGIFDDLGISKLKSGKYARHPFAFIVEAADDICYLTTDIEDAFRTKHLAFITAENQLRNIAKKGRFADRYGELNDSEEQDKIAYLRSGAVSALIIAAVNEFINNEESFLDGSRTAPLVETPEYKPHIDAIRNLCENNIYKERRKIETESAGVHIVLHLLNCFGGMICRYRELGDEKKLNIRDQHYLYIMPDYARERLKTANRYDSLLILVDFISGMTDRYALDLFAKISGTSPTIGRMV